MNIDIELKEMETEIPLSEAWQYLIKGDNQRIAKHLGITTSYVSAVRRGIVKSPNLITKYVCAYAYKRKKAYERFVSEINIQDIEYKSKTPCPLCVKHTEKFAKKSAARK